METQNGSRKNLPLKLYFGLKKHWIINTIILFFPSIWFPVIVGIFGQSLLLQNSNNSLTLFGVILTIVIYSLVFVILILNSITANKEDIIIHNKLAMINSNYEELKNLIECIHEISSNHYENLLNTVHNNPSTETSPSQQINIILHKIRDCFSKIAKINYNNMNVTIAYTFDKSKDWRWVENTTVNGNITLDELVHNPITTFYQVLTNQKDFAFYNSKKEAEANGHYLRDVRDNSHNGIGSIICKSIIVGTSEKNYVKAILTISTYGKQFVEQNDPELIENVESNIRDFLLPEFELRLQIELASLYIENIKNSLVK